jgi:hypothetical protein
MFSFSRLCKVALMGLALVCSPLLSSSVQAQSNSTNTSSSIGFCLPISNNVPTAIGFVRFDTFYDNPTWNALEKASYDPVPYQGNYQICDNVGFAVGSWYWVEVQVYYTNDAGAHVVWNDSHVHMYFNPFIPRVTVDWLSPGIDVWCSDSAC